MAHIQAAVIEVCNWCYSEVNVSWYCVNCDEKLCDNCKINHLRSKKLRNDKVIPLKESKNISKSAVTLCSDHPTEECKFFCFLCQELMCATCLHENHQDHKWTLLEKYLKSKQENLKNVLDELKLVDPMGSEAVIKEGQSHGGFNKSVVDGNSKLNVQETMIKEKITELCNKYRSMLSEMKDSENKRYQHTCNEIKTKNQTIQTTIHTAQTAMDTGNLSQIVKAEEDVKQALQETKEIYTPPKLIIPRFIPGDVTEQAIVNLIGVIQTHVEDTVGQTKKPDGTGQPDHNGEKPQSRDEDKGARPKDTKYSTNTDTQSKLTDQGASLPKQITEERKPSNVQHQDKKQEREYDSRKNRTQHQEPELRGDKTDRDREIDVTKVKVNSVIQVQGKADKITSIVPVENNRMWVTQGSDRDLTLIDCHGIVIKKSVTVNEGYYIIDVKLYNSDLLVTCYKGQRVIRMSPDGSTMSTFSDISPYYTRGLCIGHSNDVLVICVKYTSDWSTVTESKIVRLNESGSIVQTIQHDHTGAPLFTEPYYLTSLPSGDIMVTDQYKVIAVDREGRHLFTWDGKKERIKGDNNNLYCITHDRHNHVFVTDRYNHKVYVIGREGRGGKCLLDSKQGISYPLEIAINHDGQLLVGCVGGKVHVIDY